MVVCAGVREMEVCYVPTYRNHFLPIMVHFDIPILEFGRNSTPVLWVTNVPFLPKMDQ